jgi:hypothetical protein
VIDNCDEASRILKNYSNNLGEDLVQLALRGRHETWWNQSHDLIGRHEDIIKYLLTELSFNAGRSCSVYFAVHYHNVIAFNTLLGHTPTENSLKCLTTQDASGETALHTLVKSKGSAFGSFYAKLLSPDGHVQSPSDGVKDLLGLNEYPLQLASGRLTASELNEAISPVLLTIVIEHFKDKLNWSDILDINGNNLLHVSSYSGRYPVVKLLLGVAPRLANDRNALNELPIDLAHIAGHDDIVNILFSYSNHSYPTKEVCKLFNERKCVKKRILSFDGVDKLPNELKDDINCSDLPSVSAETLSPYAFKHEVESKHLPQVITGVTDGWRAWTHWTKEQLVKRYGHIKFKVSHIPYEDLYKGENTIQVVTTLEDYINSFNSSDSTPLYLFSGNILNENRALASDIKIPGFLSQRSIYLKQFIIGPKNSGAPPHFHGSAINSLIYGLKMWYFWPPSAAYFSVNHINEEHSRFEDVCYQYLQYPGETVYVPSLWGHAVINVADSIGVALEFI